ncbi:hypothetical protein MUTS16_69210 [Escherichia coli]|nr:hypothetical protein MUTS16_69210 [Escherichia coli]
MGSNPGIQTQWMSAGSQYNPYLKISYQATPDLNLALRYRYDWKAFRQTDLDGNRARNDQHQFDGYVTYKINDSWLFAWQTTVYTKVNNFKYGNHKKQQLKMHLFCNIKCHRCSPHI